MDGPLSANDGAYELEEGGHGLSHAARRGRIASILSASSGNVVEWFDFYVYSATSLYFAPEFFPSSDPTISLLNSAGIFAAGFLMRPLGSWAFGRMADRSGRRAALVLAVTLMAFGSLMVACLPTYASIGPLAPGLLLVARLIQGFSVGGEYGATATYMSEVALPERRGFYASFQYMSLIGGQLLATLVVAVMQRLLTEPEIKAWGWRLPFVLGAITGVIALRLRSGLLETTTAQTREHRDSGSLRALLKHRRALLVVLGFTAGGSLLFYTFTTYMQKYLVNSAGMDKKAATSLMTVVLFVFMLMQPLFGALSDRIGRRPAMLWYGSLAVLGTVPVLTALRYASGPATAGVWLLLALTVLSLYTSISGIIKAELFPVEVRALGVGLSYAIGNAAFGGSAEYVALWFRSRGVEAGFYWYVTAMSAVVLAAALCLPGRVRSVPQTHALR